MLRTRKRIGLPITYGEASRIMSRIDMRVSDEAPQPGLAMQIRDGNIALDNAIKGAVQYLEHRKQQAIDRADAEISHYKYLMERRRREADPVHIIGNIARTLPYRRRADNGVIIHHALHSGGSYMPMRHSIPTYIPQGMHRHYGATVVAY